MQTNILCLTILLGLHVQPTVSQTVQCYAHFDLTTGKCGDLLGEVSMDDCCMNSNYGYQEKDTCMSCRRASWTEWSSWSDCSVTCLKGVKQRRRACYGIGKCEDKNKYGTIQTKSCEEQDCCPENGGWSEWDPWQPCSVTCEKGIKQRFRTCSNPPPKCEGRCEGNNKELANCDTGIVCPTHGGWSIWGNWGACSGTCTVEGTRGPIQQRQRTCTNPPPSTVPRGNDCVGNNIESQHCTGLPFCPVNGNWGMWSQSSPCSVTCGIGRERRHRNCDNPAPKYGGLNCIGEPIQVSLCINQAHCPADGQWAEWAEWSPCASTSTKEITCRNREGKRRRVRDCLGRAYEGKFCPGENVDFGQCYDIEGCEVGEKELITEVYWSKWSDWGYCKPDCGEGSTQERKKECLPNVSKYRDQSVPFVGEPNAECPPSSETEETRPCLNVPAC